LETRENGLAAVFFQLLGTFAGARLKERMLPLVHVRGLDQAGAAGAREGCEAVVRAEIEEMMNSAGLSSLPEGFLKVVRGERFHASCQEWVKRAFRDTWTNDIRPWFPATRTSPGPVSSARSRSRPADSADLVRQDRWDGRQWKSALRVVRAHYSLEAISRATVMPGDSSRLSAETIRVFRLKKARGPTCTKLEYALRALLSRIV
jgi:hypothetical protein